MRNLTNQEKELFRRNLSNMLKYGKEELNNYENTNNIVSLQQSGEKLFNAVESYISILNNQRYYSYGDIVKSIYEKPLIILIEDANKLHRFFYTREMEMTPQRAKELCLSVYRRLSVRVKELK